mmetsp:Transcript_8203/g.11060  ORF Transcript_8203/g.11060 Transcript_8203/m.11060 type:complete len:218 (+) Transcript_8203:33-686(+)
MMYRLHRGSQICIKHSAKYPQQLDSFAHPSRLFILYGFTLSCCFFRLFVFFVNLLLILVQLLKMIVQQSNKSVVHINKQFLKMLFCSLGSLHLAHHPCFFLCGMCDGLSLSCCCCLRCSLQGTCFNLFLIFLLHTGSLQPHCSLCCSVRGILRLGLSFIGSCICCLEVALQILSAGHSLVHRQQKNLPQTHPLNGKRSLVVGQAAEEKVRPGLENPV